MTRILLYIIISTLLIIGCKEQPINQPSPQYNMDYYPTTTGLWRQYDVTHIIIDKPSLVWDTSHYQLLEVYTNWIMDASSDSVMRIERFTRDSSHHEWTILNVWLTYIKDNDVFQTEDNNKYLKIKYPLKKDSQWNGNIYNNLDSLPEYYYTISSFDIPHAIDELVFDSTLTVTQKDKSSIIDKIYYFETYANGVGLIERQQIDIYSDDVDASIPIEQRVTRGSMYYQKITNYGKN